MSYHIRTGVDVLSVWMTLLFSLLAGGCASYQYDIVEPADLAQRVGTKDAVALPIDPVRYEAKTYSDRLVLFVQNESDQPLKLLGDDSYAVDPRGESHPLPTRTIAPGSSTKLIFPPVRPTLRQSGPNIGFGVGVGLGSARRGYYGRRGFAGEPFFYDHTPRYYRLEDDGTVYWNWTGDGTTTQVRIVYQLGEKQLHHDFVFRRVKV